jgi:pimeloyl-ACP methyl ester carboxylesterase
LHVVAVQIPLTSLADDVATVERAIQLQDGPVILVGHSYGGAVITQAGNDPKVAGLVFVAAFAPDAGQSVLSIEAPYPTQPLSGELTVDAYGFLLITPAGVANDFAQDLSQSEKNLLTATEGPTNVACLTSPVTSAAWRNKPAWFAVASDDRAIPPQLEADEAATMNAFTITLDSSHVAMLSHPKEVSELIEDATEGRR